MYIIRAVSMCIPRTGDTLTRFAHHISRAATHAREIRGLQRCECGEVSQGLKNVQIPYALCGISMSLEDHDTEATIPITRYCWPVETLEELHRSFVSIRSRLQQVGADLEDGGSRTSQLADLIEAHLNTAMPGDSASRTKPNESGEYFLFLHVLTPIPRDKSRRRALLDDAANGIPLLIAVLMPHLGFQLSEVEVAYDFSVDTSIDDQFGEGAVGHVLVHDDVPFLDVSSTFSVLLDNHPALLIALAHGVVFERDLGSRLLRATLRTLTEVMHKVSASLASPEVLTYLTPTDVKATVTSIFADATTQLGDILSPQTDIPPATPREETRVYLAHVINEAFDTLLTEEMIIFDKIYEKTLTTQPLSSNAMEVDDESDLPRFAGVRLLRHAIQRSRRRMIALRRSIPGEDAE